jgi:hypothetical protein
MGTENWENDNERMKAEVLAEKSDKALICPLQIPHRLTWKESRTSGLRGLGYSTACYTALLSLLKFKISFCM